ncbi:telomere repeats-binding bouquet formation protein 1, partial [Biomphalaria glabrata]
LESRSNISTAKKAETQTDILTLLENVKCQKNNAPVLKQALGALASICSTNSASQDYFRSVGGIEILQDLLINDTCPPPALCSALLCLACAVHQNVASQNLTLTEDMMSLIHLYFSQQDCNSNILKAAAFLLACLIDGNGKGQWLANSTECLQELTNIVRNLIAVKCNEDDRWAIVSRAVGVCVNNPQSVTNQQVCCSLLPHVLKLISTTPEHTCIQHVLSMFCLVMANNALNQERIYQCGGVTTLVKFIEHYTRSESPSLSCNTVTYAVAALDACISDHEKACQQAGEMGAVSLLLNLLYDTEQGHNYSQIIVLTIAHVLEYCKEYCSLVSQGRGHQLLVSYLTETQDDELFKAIKYVFTLCKVEGETQKPGPETSASSLRHMNDVAKLCTRQSDLQEFAKPREVTPYVDHYDWEDVADRVKQLFQAYNSGKESDLVSVQEDVYPEDLSRYNKGKVTAPICPSHIPSGRRPTTGLQTHQFIKSDGSRKSNCPTGFMSAEKHWRNLPVKHNPSSPRIHQSSRQYFKPVPETNSGQNLNSNFSYLRCSNEHEVSKTLTCHRQTSMLRDQIVDTETLLESESMSDNDQHQMLSTNLRGLKEKYSQSNSKTNRSRTISVQQPRSELSLVSYKSQSCQTVGHRDMSRVGDCMNEPSVAAGSLETVIDYQEKKITDIVQQVMATFMRSLTESLHQPLVDPQPEVIQQKPTVTVQLSQQEPPEIAPPHQVDLPKSRLGEKNKENKREVTRRASPQSRGTSLLTFCENSQLSSKDVREFPSLDLNHSGTANPKHDHMLSDKNNENKKDKCLVEHSATPQLSHLVLKPKNSQKQTPSTNITKCLGHFISQPAKQKDDFVKPRTPLASSKRVLPNTRISHNHRGSSDDVEVLGRENAIQKTPPPSPSLSEFDSYLKEKAQTDQPVMVFELKPSRTGYSSTYKEGVITIVTHPDTSTHSQTNLLTRNIKVSLQGEDSDQHNPELKDQEHNVYSFLSEADLSVSTMTRRQLNALKGNKRRVQVPYTDQEVRNLLTGVSKMGKSWKHILNSYKFHPIRTSVDLKDKYKKLMAEQGKHHK